MTGLQEVSNSNSIIRNLNDNNGHLERYFGRPLVNLSKPYWRASASGGKSTGRSSNEMITIEQYAPLITCCQSWNNHSMGKLLTSHLLRPLHKFENPHRAVSISPTISTCLRLGQRSNNDQDNSHCLPINQPIGLFSSDHRQRQHCSIARGNMGHLPMTPAKPTGGVLHGCKGSNDSVHVRHPSPMIIRN